MNNYITNTLVTRNVNCANLTEDEFIKMLNSDILEAVEKYNDVYAPEYVARTVRNYESYMKSRREHATKYATNKWKTEKKRNEFIDKEVAKYKAAYSMNSYYYGLSFFDLDVHPESNGLSGSCCISVDRLTPRALQACFNEIKDNYYFKNSMGWKLEYECHENDHQVCFRPHITLIMPEEVEKRYRKAQEDLAEDIRRFYANCHYCGD